jgi:hypothetical protein
MLLLNFHHKSDFHLFLSTIIHFLIFMDFLIVIELQFVHQLNYLMIFYVLIITYLLILRIEGINAMLMHTIIMEFL